LSLYHNGLGFDIEDVVITILNKKLIFSHDLFGNVGIFFMGPFPGSIPEKNIIRNRLQRADTLIFEKLLSIFSPNNQLCRDEE